MNSARRVILFLPSFETGGVERNAVLFANGMIDAGHEVDLLYVKSVPGFFDSLSPHVRKAKIDPAFRIPGLHPRLVDAVNILLFSNAFLRSLKLGRKPVIVAFQSGVIAIMLAIVRRIPIIVRLSNHPSSAVHDRTWVRRVSEWAKRFAYRHADKVVANSSELAEVYSGIIGKPVEVIRNPVDPAHVLLRSKAPIADGEWPRDGLPLIVSAGRLTAQKNYPMLVDAFSLVHLKAPSRLLLIGEGEDRHVIESAILRHGLEGRVTLLGYRSNIYPYVAAADVFVLSSHYEGLPNVLLEALALGKPVVSTRCPTGPAEILLGGRGGELVPPGNAPAMADAIIRVLNDPVAALTKTAIAMENLSAYSREQTMHQYDTLIRES